jgi:hypothetical protein
MRAKLTMVLMYGALATLAWGKPAKLTLRVPQSELEAGNSVEVAILPTDNEEANRLLRIEANYAGMPGIRPIVLSNVPITLREQQSIQILSEDSLNLFVISSQRLGFGAELLVRNDEFRVRGIELTPGIKYNIRTTYRRFGKLLTTVEQPVNAFSGENNDVDVRQPSLLHNITKGIFEKDNLPVGISVLFGAALVAAVREKLKTAWDAVLNSIGKLGVRALAERSFTRKYLHNLEYQHKYLKLVGLTGARLSPPLLDRVFVSLRIAPQQSNDSCADVSVAFATAVAKFPKFVILGAPGAGKTTILSYTVLRFANGRPSREFGGSEPLLPIFIPLRRVLAKNASLLDDVIDRDTQIIPDEVLDHLPAEYFERRMKRGGCILLLDGMDEVASEAAHRQVAQKINNLAISYPKNRFIVTCRIAGWQGLLPEFQVLQTQDLNREEIQGFITGWHSAVISEKERSELRLKEPDDSRFDEEWRKRRDIVATAIDVQSRKLSNAIEGSQRIQAVATNPMLLSLICLVHLNRHILPRGRSLLYRECIELLTDTWDRSRDLIATAELTYNQKESALRHIALEFQRAGKGELSRSEVEKVAGEVAKNLGATISPTAFVDALERRSGLLIERSIDVLGFSHLTLQEYLVARHIQKTPDLVPLLRMNFDFQGWREVILLYCGLVDDATSTVRDLLVENSNARVLLAAHCIGESQKCDQNLVTSVTDVLLSWLQNPPISEEELIGALAAVASDYTDTPMTVEQQLAHTLIGHLERRTDQAGVAIQALSRARVTRALPSLVEIALSDVGETPNLVASAAVVAFGNLALPTLRAASWHATSPLQQSLRINILEMINTSLSARAVIADFVHEPSNTYVAYVLSRMLKNPIILDELLDLSDEEIPPFLQTKAVRERDGWKYSRSCSDGFRRLEAMLRSELGARLGAKSDEALNLRIVVPALIDRLRTDPAFTASPDLLRGLGFEVDQSHSALLLQLNAAVKRNEAELWPTLERTSPSTPGTAQESRLGMVQRNVSVGLAALLYLFTLFFFGMIAKDLLDTNARFFSGKTLEIMSVWAAISIGLYVLLTGIVLWWRRRRIRSWEFYGAAIFPLPAFLRRIPAIVPGWPWLGFIIFSIFVLVCSLTGIIAFLVVETHRTWDASSILFMLTGIVLVLCLAHFYRAVVLRTDILREVILLHPDGRELLRRP